MSDSSSISMEAILAQEGQENFLKGCPVFVDFVPEYFKTLELKQSIWAEFLSVTPNNNPESGINVNHVVWRVELTEQHLPSGFHAFRLSMDISNNGMLLYGSDASGETEPGVFFNPKKDDLDYSSGALQIKGLKYKGRTYSAAEHFEYDLREGTTLKNLIDVAANLNMVGFSFQLYDNRWQGCRDYMTQYHYNLVLQGILIDRDASFYQRHIGFVYIKGVDPIRKYIERGVFERYARRLHYLMPYDKEFMEKEGKQHAVDNRAWEDVVVAAGSADQ